MTIGGYTLTPEEERRVLSIHERLSAHFPSARIDFQEEIIGIGEEGRYRFCYFALREGELRVKFKHRIWQHLDDEERIEGDVVATVNLFRTKEMLLPQSKLLPPKGGEKEGNEAPHEEAAPPIPVIDPFTMQGDHLLYNEAMGSIPAEKDETTFGSCSTRLRNALYRNGISSIRALRGYSAVEIASIHNLGRRSFRELCEFLISLAEGRLSEEAEGARTKAELIRHIQNTHLEVAADPADIPTAFEGDGEEYAAIYSELIHHLEEAVALKLERREWEMLRARIGFGEESKTLRKIAELHGITHERVRQLLKRARRKLLTKRISSDALIALERERLDLANRIAKVKAGAFLAYLLLRNESYEMVEFIGDIYLHTDLSASYFKSAFRETLKRKRRQDAKDEKATAFNDWLYRAITFPAGQRRITDEDFARLKQRVKRVDEEPPPFPCDEEPQKERQTSVQRLLQRLQDNKSFRDVAVKALKVPYRKHYFIPHFQCLTHEGTLVLIVVVSVFEMCKAKRMKRFEALREYCARYGFGYLITDDRENSFEEICEENPAFSEAVMAEIEAHGHIEYATYREIYQRTKATSKHLLALIKAHDLRFAQPFVLKAPRKKRDTV